MTGSRAEASAVKRCRQLEADLNWVRKRIPGRSVCDDLERVAAMLRFDNPDWSDTEDAAKLDALAARLREIRTHMRGEGRHERTAQETAALIVLNDGNPFEDAPSPSLSDVLGKLAGMMGDSRAEDPDVS